MIEQMPTRELINQMYLNNFTLFSFALIPFFILFFPSVLYGIPIIAIQKDYAYTLPPKDVEKELSDDENKNLKYLATQIEDYLYTNKPFIDPNFSLDDLARQLNVPKHYLYCCFNSVFQKKFSTLRKEIRVMYAKELLLQGNLLNQSMEGIWTKAGFSSKTNFFISFKDVTGFTPL